MDAWAIAGLCVVAVVVIAAVLAIAARPRRCRTHDELAPCWVCDQLRREGGMST